MIEVVREGPVWRLTLARPERANALTGAMLRDLRAAVAEAAGEARVIVLTGQGKVFSAGADLKEVATGLATDPAWEALSAEIAGAEALTVAALNGTCAGGALGMVLACDLRVAAEGAEVFYPVMRNGLLPQPSDAGRLRALVGPARTKLLLMTGARLSAREAWEIGLFDRVVPAEGLAAAVEGLIADAVAADPALQRAIARMCDGD